ncbi:MAG: hypothetical protein LUC45_07330 [Paraprevotella sp.]|nr:hypothetical protein [Paraprevotella sp.]
MKYRFRTGCCALLCPLCLQAQKWLPNPLDEKQEIRLLDCRYEEEHLKSCTLLTDTSSVWSTSVTQSTVPGGILYVFRFKALKDLSEAGVAVAFDRYRWSSDDYVMIPAAVYNGNRQRIVNRNYATGLDPSDYDRPDLALTSNPIPQLSPDFGSPSRIEVSVCNAATPAIAFLDRKANEGILLLTDQGIERNDSVTDYGLNVEESPDRNVATFVISAPGVREKKPEFIGFSKSPDRGMEVHPGDEVTLRITRLSYPCRDVPQLLAHFMQDRKRHITGRAPRNLIPMSEVLNIMDRDIDLRYFQKDSVEFYRPESADWMSYGWIGELIDTYPMLALGDQEHLRRVARTFDFALPRAKGKSGYYYDILQPDGTVLNRDAAAVVPGIGLTRRNGNVLYWMVKQFNLLERMHRADLIRPDLEKEVRRRADAFVRTWKNNRTWGNYLHVETGEVAVYRTTGGAMAVGGLALASAYFHCPEYLEVARQAARELYDQFALCGFTSGGCGDILQNSDSETAIALTTSLMTLYELTGEGRYLNQARDVAHLCATWTVSLDYRLPPYTPLEQLGANLTGSVWASTQNKHGAPGFCTQSGDALFKLYRTTGDTLYAELLRDVIHAHAEGIQPNGKITERLTYCDADRRGSRADGWETGWNETNGALMALEIPGIYVRTDRGSIYVFDQVEASLVRNDKEKTLIRIKNPTKYDAVVTLFAEGAEEASRPLGDNAFLDWTDKVKVKAGQTVTYTLKHAKGKR